LQAVDFQWSNFAEKAKRPGLVVVGYNKVATELVKTVIKRRGGSYPTSLLVPAQPRQQPQESSLGFVVPHSHCHCLFLTDQHNDFFAASDARVV
jgi:hypothetical protein